jgi:hypothetical protein
MKPPLQGVYQSYMKVVLLAFIMILLSFWIAPSPTPALANSELASEVFGSVTILDSYLISRSGSAYGLHVLVNKEADFMPVQIRISDPRATYKILSLTLAPKQHCPFADPQIQAKGMITALKAGELVSYDSHYLLGYQFTSASRQSVDLIVEVEGKLFVINELQVSGGCFWAQE